MLLYFSESHKTPVFIRQGDVQMIVGFVVDFVINPDDGIFQALWVRSPAGLRFLDTKDIVRWTSQGILVEEEEDLIAQEDFPRIQSFLDQEVPILRAKVFEHQKCIGRVIDFSFDTLSPRILSILVRTGWWVFGSQRIISRSQIDRITNEGIFIRQNIIHTEEKEEKVRLDMEPSPEPDASRIVGNKEAVERE